MTDNKTALTFLVLVLLIIAGSYYFFIRPQAAPSPIAPFVNLVEKNISFKQAIAKFEALKWSEAEPLLITALAQAETPEEEAQIKAKLGAVKQLTGDVPAAIAIFKEIAADTRYSNIARAYAVEYMALMFIGFGKTSATAEIFEDEPYKSFYDPKDIFLSYRKLFEYASSFYPLAISEARIADWYANRILQLSPKGKTLTAQEVKEIVANKEIIRAKFASVDRDIVRIQNIPDASLLVPAALERKAIIAGKLARTGDDSFGAPERMFDEALTAYRARRAYDGFAFYNYAAFLANAYGEKRKDDIRKLLYNFYAKETYRNTSVFGYFTAEKDNTFGNRPTMMLLASLDPNFKKLLMELGWKF